MPFVTLARVGGREVELLKRVRAGVVARLRERRGELVQAIFARVSDGAFGPVGVRDAEYMAGLRAAVGAAVEHGLQGIERGEEEDGSPPTPIPLAVLEQARRAARLGVSLDTVLRRYVVGHTLLEEFVMEEADRGVLPDEKSAVPGALRAQAMVLDRLLAAITSEYGDELERAERSPERRLLESVRSLLAGERVDGVGVELGYELDGEHVGVMARGAGAREALRGVAGELDRRLLCVDCGEGTVWAWLGGQRGLEMAALEQALAKLGGVSFAVGEPARGLAGWRLTHQQAQAALVVALRRPPRRSTRYGDVALLATALNDEALARALVDVYIAPLDDASDRGPVLRQTLRVYLDAECSVSSAAVALNVARSTVEKRLRMVEDKLGRSLHPCPAELEVALGLHELGGTAVIWTER
jgi:diguanylate cyclase with GGDEF domain/PucR-like helix-turn-helix protein